MSPSLPTSLRINCFPCTRAAILTRIPTVSSSIAHHAGSGKQPVAQPRIWWVLDSDPDPDLYPVACSEGHLLGGSNA